MSVYKKIAEARVKLQEAGLKKSGKNNYSGYDYFELEDFLPEINKINAELGLCTIVTYTQDMAMLKIIDVDKPDDTILVTSPMREAKLKGCHDIQNLGAVESYQRRYLYITAYEIAESDTLDAIMGKDNVKANNKSTSNLSEAQIKRLYALGKKAGFDGQTVKGHIHTKFNCSVKDLNKEQYDKICEGYQKGQKEGK